MTSDMFGIDCGGPCANGSCDAGCVVGRRDAIRRDLIDQAR